MRVKEIDTNFKNGVQEAKVDVLEGSNNIQGGLLQPRKLAKEYGVFDIL